MNSIQKSDYFDYELYVSLHPDLRHLKYADALIHYKKYGVFENRIINLHNYFNHNFNELDIDEYKNRYTDLSDLDKSQAIHHILHHGFFEKRCIPLKKYDFVVYDEIQKLKNIYKNYNETLNETKLNAFTAYLEYVHILKNDIVLCTDDKIYVKNNADNNIYPYTWQYLDNPLPIKQLPLYIENMLKYKKTFFHSGELGDIVYSLPTIRELGGGILYLNTNGKRNGSNDIIRFNKKSFDYIKLLLCNQFYIYDVILHTGQSYEYDLDTFVTNNSSYTVNANLPELFLYQFKIPFAVTNFPWIHLKTTNTKNKKIVCSRGPRYRCYQPVGHTDNTKLQKYNEKYDKLYKFIFEKYSDYILVVGLEDECNEVKLKYNNSIETLTTQSALELANILNNSNLLICNASFVYSIGEALKMPVLLELSGNQCGNFWRSENLWTFTDKITDIYVIDAVIKYYIST